MTITIKVPMALAASDSLTDLDSVASSVREPAPCRL